MSKWSWRYIVIKREGCYQIHEGYGQGVPHSWTDSPIAPMGETLGELRADLQMMLLDVAEVFEERGKKLRRVK